jgi:protein phosphatase
MTLTPAAVTLRGRRHSNQDRVCIQPSTVGGQPAVVMAVADGIGGLMAGEHAAELSLETVRDFADEQLPGLPALPAVLRSSLTGLVGRASRRVRNWGERHGVAGAIGSTLVCAVVFGRQFLVAHAGDSRCYVVDRRAARLLTEDHTLAQEEVRRGTLPAALARRSPLASRLTSALGGPFVMRVDLAPASGLGSLADGALLLLCSDGLHDVLDEADLVCVLRHARSVEHVCETLVALAYERGSSDNISVAATAAGELDARAAAVKDASASLDLAGAAF